ncbi:MAG TPA: alkaline phosphatase family protein [Thermoanaerobaculia bacterium]|nr:alkaline phosphatase family protein [Thermoanaerobaculia bacterium]
MRPLARAFLALSLLLAALIGGVALWDALTAERFDHRPILSPSALDRLPAAHFAAGDCSSELPGRLMVIGWDSADWDLIFPLLERGELPHLASLMAEGTAGTLATFLPSVSPALWTTVATGVEPDRHGILGFYEKRPRLERWWQRLTHFGRLERRLFSANDRRVRAIWNLLTEARRGVLVVGFHNTFPVEQVEGAMVSNYLTQDSIARLMSVGVDADPQLAHNLVTPPQLLDRVLAIQREVDASLPEAARRFSGVAERDVAKLLERGRELPREGDQRPWFLLHAYAFDEINARIATDLYPGLEPDALFVHFQAVDWAVHQFLAFHRPEDFGEVDWPEATLARLRELEPLYRDTVSEYYRYLDEWLGRLLALRDPRTAVIVLSDHGAGAGPDPDTPGNHDDGPPGMIVLAGPGIRSGARVEGATLYDVLPTMAALLGLPRARDLPGQVLEGALCPGAWIPARQPEVASYTPEPEFRPPAARPEALQDDLLKQLEALGYIDD